MSKEHAAFSKLPDLWAQEIVAKFLATSFEEGLRKIPVGDGQACFESLHQEVHRLLTLLKVLWRHRPQEYLEEQRVLREIGTLTSKVWTYRTIKVKYSLHDVAQAFWQLVPVVIHLYQLEHARINCLSGMFSDTPGVTFHPSYLETSFAIIKYSQIRDVRPQRTKEGRIYTTIRDFATFSLAAKEYQELIRQVAKGGKWPTLSTVDGSVVIVHFDQVQSMRIDQFTVVIKYQSEVQLTTDTLSKKSDSRITYYCAGEEIKNLWNRYQEWVKGK
jgi:hypothetical protein